MTFACNYFALTFFGIANTQQGQTRLYRRYILGVVKCIIGLVTGMACINYLQFRIALLPMMQCVAEMEANHVIKINVNVQNYSSI